MKNCRKKRSPHGFFTLSDMIPQRSRLLISQAGDLMHGISRLRFFGCAMQDTFYSDAGLPYR